MQSSPAKRLLHLLLLLAFVAGSSLSAMPMAIADDGMAPAGMAGGCGGCDKQDTGLMAGACVAVCVAPLAVVAQAPLLLRPVAWQPRGAAVSLPAGLTIPPDASPPRT